MNVTLLFTSFLAGLLTVIAPCILPLLPVIVGGSLTGKNKWKPLIIALLAR
jgi:cytochrome c biogenesis protein CcdA